MTTKEITAKACAEVAEMLSRINIDIAFIVASGYSAEGGFTCGKEAEAFVKHEVIRKARTVAMLLDNSKIGAMLPFTFANMEDIDYLITEAEIPEQTAEEAAKYGVKLL